MAPLQSGEISLVRDCPLGLSAAIGAAIDLQKVMASLRRERDTLIACHWTGTASEQDLRRYRNVRFALSLYASPARRPLLPSDVDDVLRRRSEVELELIVGTEVADPPVAS